MGGHRLLLVSILHFVYYAQICNSSYRFYYPQVSNSSYRFQIVSDKPERKVNKKNYLKIYIIFYNLWYLVTNLHAFTHMFKNRFILGLYVIVFLHVYACVVQCLWVHMYANAKGWLILGIFLKFSPKTVSHMNPEFSDLLV